MLLRLFVSRKTHGICVWRKSKGFCGFCSGAHIVFCSASHGGQIFETVKATVGWDRAICTSLLLFAVKKKGLPYVAEIEAEVLK